MFNYKPLLLLCLLGTETSQASFYRWVDAKGIVHYTDAIPPENAQTGHLELDAQGMRIKSVAAALSKEQIEQEAAKRLSNHDENLVANYLSVTELEAVYRAKLALLEKNKQFMQTRREALVERVTQVKAQIAEHKASDNEKQLQDFVIEATQTLKSYDSSLYDMDQEQERLKQTFEKDKQRLSELLAKQAQ
jgi:hypothetical protein